MRRYVNFTDQSRFVQELNTEFGAVAEAGGFATAVVATYTASGDDLAVCNAGHPRPLRYSAKSRSWDFVSHTSNQPGLANVPLGIAEPTRYDQSRHKLSTGDLVVMYTDSLIEAKGADGRMLGEQGILKVAGGLDPSDPAEFLRALLAAIFPATVAGSEDDVTVLILRPNGLKPRVSAGVKMKAMSRLAMAALTCWLPGGPEFPWPEPGPRAMLRGLLKRPPGKGAKAAG
jgi:serine phosphatase RsbU (regulator of sigma subunit)